MKTTQVVRNRLRCSLIGDIYKTCYGRVKTQPLLGFGRQFRWLSFWRCVECYDRLIACITESYITFQFSSHRGSSGETAAWDECTSIGQCWWNLVFGCCCLVSPTVCGDSLRTLVTKRLSVTGGCVCETDDSQFPRETVSGVKMLAKADSSCLPTV